MRKQRSEYAYRVVRVGDGEPVAYTDRLERAKDRARYFSIIGREDYVVLDRSGREVFRAERKRPQ